MCSVVLGAFVLGRAQAVQVGALEYRWDWRLAEVRIEGARAISEGDVAAAMLTLPRPWYAPWRELPEFDPSTFEGDVERVRALYRRHGYYDASVVYDLELPALGNELVAVLYVDEGSLVRTESVTIAGGEGVAGADEKTLLALVPLAPGDAFVEERYRTGSERIEAWFRERSYAHVVAARHARVDVAARSAVVRYDVTPGPPCTFGDVTVEGNEGIETDVIRREVAFEADAPFKQSALDRTRTNLNALGLFSSVRVTTEGSGERVDVRIAVVEGPTHAIRLGIGYDSEEQVRGLASWRHYDFLGGARQLGFAGRYSLLRRSLVADFLQPHFPVQTTRLRLIALQQREDEEPYTLDRSRGTIRVEWEPALGVVAQASYRAEYASLADVSEAVKHALPDATPHSAVLSSLALGVDWNHTDEPLDPTKGVFLRSAVEPYGGFLGGGVDFVRVSCEVRGYVPLLARTFAAMRVRVGTAQPTGSTHDVPIWERFFSGGTDSVRGYERWHVGPMAGGDPIGGKSLLEGAVELRQRVTETIAIVVFADGGQVVRQSWRFPIDDLQLGIGAGVRYRTPIGPIRVDLGFPLDRPRGDDAWQLHFSVGPSF